MARDGTDATEKIVGLFKRTRFRDQIRLIAVNGIGFAGLNIIDIKKVEKATGAKMLSVTRRRPHPPELIGALKSFSKLEHKDVTQRLKLMALQKKLPVYKVGAFFAQTTMELPEARKFVEHSAALLRLAHMIASGVVKGESKGRV